MSSSVSVDAARLELMLTELRLPAIKAMWAAIAAHSDKEGWPAARLLAALAEHEIAERSRRRIERHLAEAHLPIGKTFDSFDFETRTGRLQGASDGARAEPRGRPRSACGPPASVGPA